MRKFLVLLKKEIKELITLKLVLPLVLVAFVFMFLGNIMSSEKAKMEAKFVKPAPIAVMDLDQSNSSESLAKELTNNNFLLVMFDDKEIDTSLQRSYGNTGRI